MAERRADLDALGAALAVDRVDEDAERARLDALAWRARRRTSCVVREVARGRSVAASGRLGLVGGERLDARRRAPAPARRCRGWPLSGQALTQAMQPTHLSSEELRDARGEAAEVAGRGRAGRDDAAGQADVRGQLLVGDATAIGGHDRTGRTPRRRRRRRRSAARSAPSRASWASLGSPGVLDERGVVRHRGPLIHGLVRIGSSVMAWTTSVSESTPIGSASSPSSTTTGGGSAAAPSSGRRAASGVVGWTVIGGVRHQVADREARPVRPTGTRSRGRGRGPSATARRPATPDASTTGRPLMWC